jgi:hypothetical protein
MQSPPPAQAVVQKSSPLIKILVAIIAVIFVFGVLVVGGIVYAAHRVSQKVHEVTDGLMTADTTAAKPSLGDVCRFLSKEDVNKAIGVEIVRTKSEDASCSYIAKGDQADMTARHATAMMASKGADKQTQQAIQQFAGGMFKAFQEQDKKNRPADDSGEVMVFQFSIDQNAAEAQMKLNSKVMGALGPTGAEGLAGIGDQAMVSADTMLMFRKGDKLVRIMYMTCPCGTEAVKPLARMLADRL